MSVQGISDSQNYSNFDNLPKQSAERPQQKSEIVTMSMDKVDSEIAGLKAKGLAIAKSINSYDDEDTRLHLEQQLSQIQNELRHKDNDIYRRQNAQISMGINIEA